ncbi:hypothetical protein EDB89DRAFT_1901620 [Lactarius sanguifluus]|nr:hypothetical protein EDB89DRAFT_1901620 [Lactarius sanguifluus]
MESPSATTLQVGLPDTSFSAANRPQEDVASLTSFNPFSEEDEHDQSSYALMTSLFSRVKNTFTTPLSSAPLVSIGTGVAVPSNTVPAERRRPPTSVVQNHFNDPSRSSHERPPSMTVVSSHLAPPLVSLTPVVSEGLTFNSDIDSPISRVAFINPSASDGLDGGLYGTTIPGFSIPEDARSIRTAPSIRRSASVSKVIRRIRGEGLSKDYWMDDKTCKECYDCKSVFTAWRRKHHCRICGQIFCSRCASNIIKGSRFGHDGMIRVCNLCLEKLANEDEDDDDDRRSISSVVSPFAAHQFGSDPLSLSLARHPQSPFAASQLFGRTEEPFNLFSIAETRRLISGSDDSGFSSRPLTPLGRSQEDSWGPQAWKAAAPFRRGLVDDDKDLSIVTDTFPQVGSPIASGVKTPLDFPATIPVPGALNSVQFPLSSPDRVPDSPGPQSVPRRVPSRLTDFMMAGDPGWRTRRESTAQMLTKENIPNVMEWEETLLKLALRIARELTFTAHPHRQGPDMDVRRYVKIKKIPGGAPKDSEYVDGAVITKNVAHKSMTRSQRNPRVMLVTFPLEFSRVEGQYMQFGQIVRQEKEYMGNLPSPGLSRRLLYNLSRAMTQADVFSSMDKLALEPRLGHCARFRIQTFDHPLIPGHRKTYMRFEGCNREMGCTIVLRGGDPETLRRIKHVTRFLTFVVRSLKLETHLWKDSVISLPPLTADAVPSNYPFRSSVAGSPSHYDHSTQFSDLTPMIHDVEADLPDDDAEQLRLSRRIQQALDPYLTTFISVSATLRFLPPYPLGRMKELDDELTRAKHAWEDEVRKIESLSSPALAMTPSPRESLFAGNEPGYFDYKPSFASSQVTLSAILPPARTPIEEPLVLKSTEDIALESQYDLVKWQHQEQQRIWEWYLRKNADDFIVEKYQCISLREYTFPTEEYGHRASCFPPSLRYITYYGENDCTLGQFIESSTADTLSWTMNPKQPICTGKGCNQPLARHCKIYVHNQIKIFVAVEQWDGQIIGLGPTPELTTTWSACRICGSATPFIPISEEMQRYSFAKFLELHFYPADVQLVYGAGCEHNIYQHHIRYFAKRGMTVRFQADPITLHETVFPPMRIRVRPETQLRLKNADYERLMNRNSRWAELESTEVVRMVNEIYRDSPSTDTLALNQVRSYLQDKIVAWQVDFDKLPKLKGGRGDKGSRRTSTFGTVRAIWPRRLDFPDHAVPSSSVSEAEETAPPTSTRRMTGDSFVSPSSASEASETEGPPETIKVNETQEPEKAIKPTADPSNPEATPLTKSDPESDSTIEAPKAGSIASGAVPDASTQVSPVIREVLPTDQTALPGTMPNSRLPRRQIRRPSVAELVKKYSEFLPSQGVEELARTALSPHLDTAESEQESAAPWPKPQAGRSRLRRPLERRPSASDFESSYAANVAPRYLMHSRRPTRRVSQSSRIPGPVGSSNYTSRQHSPEKPVLSFDSDVATKPGIAKGLIPSVIGRGVTTKPSRNLGKDKSQLRTVSGTVSKSVAMRRGVAPPGTRVSNIAKHFERINKDNERANRRYAVIRGRRARPVASSRAKVEVLDSVKDAIQDESESSDSSSEADDEGGDDEDTQKSSAKVSPEVSRTLPAHGAGDEPKDPAPVQFSELNAPSSSADCPEVLSGSPLVSQRETLTSAPPSPYLADTKAPTPTPHYDPDLGPPGQERNSLFSRALSGFWPQNIPHRNRGDDEADDPRNDPEHIFRDSSMVVRTDEPTSIIALALSSQQYRDMLAKSRAEKRQSREPRLTEGGEAFMPDDRSVAGSTSTWGVVNIDPPENGDPTDELRAPSSKLPWAITFESGGLTISCTVLFPEQFDALRRTYDCHKSMIESLARCVKWNASGGKSGSAFLKTLDDRFIAKEMSKIEFQTMESFAPSYFAYMSSAVSANRPTLLAKVLGCYKISFKKSGKDKGSGRWKSTQMNLIVMENLFYDRRFSKIYDLKGSTRNRHVKSTGRENEVLLDENLVQSAHLAPFYLREHSKRILRGALYNDSKFLADINVMDYSLVVGVDSEKNELVVGIVDYVRTYTLDKKLENWVKESGFLGGAGKEPTVVTPKLYRQRFVSAMERYFPLVTPAFLDRLTVPDRWSKQKDAPEEEGNILLDLWPDW